MPDIPEDAITAAADALRNHPHASGAYPWRQRALVALEAAAPAIRADERQRIAREIPPDKVRAGMDGLAKINANRARIAGSRDADRARRALEVLGERCSQRTRTVAEARIADPGAPWSEIGERLGMTKDQASGVFWRMMHRVPVRRALREDGDS